MNKKGKIHSLKVKQRKLKGSYNSKAPTRKGLYNHTTRPRITRLSGRQVKIKGLRQQQKDLKKYPPKKLNKRMLFS